MHGRTDIKFTVQTSNFLIDRNCFVNALTNLQIYTPGGADMMLFSLIQLAVQKVCSEVWQYLAASILG
jgi:hypothetical protein